MTDEAWIVEAGRNPSTDDFVRPWLERTGRRVITHRLDAPPVDAPPGGVQLVFVRYLNPAWRAWVARHRQRIAGLAWFIDDDIFSLRASAGLPLRYRWKLLIHARRHLAWLNRHRAQGLTSSDWLARRYGHRLHTGLSRLPMVSPYPIHAPPEPASQTCFYHGSASHAREHRWLRPVIEAVLARRPAARFEVIADRRIARIYAGLDRVDCIPPMDWPDYRRWVVQPGRAIGLAPLCDTRFNAARAPTKTLDITAAGAAGIYADHPVYRSVVVDGINGRLCRMDQAAWVEAIVELLDSPAARARLWEGRSR